VLRVIFLALLLSLSILALPASATLPLLEPLSDGARLDLPSFNVTTPRPSDFLGYPLGKRFTHHDRIVAYMEALYDSSDRVTLRQYGNTYEGRPLLLMAISSSENIARLDEIRENHLKLADPSGVDDAEIERIVSEDPVVTWLGYGVHGNESSSAEAALLTAYTLAAANTRWAERLNDVVVLIDPLVNPDGRERYVHFFETQSGRAANPSPLASEHWEPWPGGRQNHYLIDLNRDWAWGTQLETRSRLNAYNRWEPQVFVDFHEMWSDSTYFFPPAADPISPHIPKTTEGWLETFGRANATAFDQQGWTYYVGERFDLFYPAYGDSYPGLRGAIGMTYEMAGHGRAGSSIRRSDGSLLTLADRLARHFTTSMATVQASIDNREQLLRDFVASRSAAIEASPRSYLWEPSHSGRAAATLLGTHGIRVERLPEDRQLTVHSSKGGAAIERELPAGSFVVSTRQPLGELARVLLELNVPMDSEFIERQRQFVDRNQRPQFYDITAWALPLALHFEAWTTDGDIRGDEVHLHHEGTVQGEGELGYLIPPQGLGSFRAAARLQNDGLRYRLTISDLQLNGTDYGAGTLFVPRRGNPETLDASMSELAYDTRIDRAGTGLADDGVSLGSDAVVPIRKARIGLLSGEGIGVTSFGAIWFLLDRQVQVEHHRLDAATLRRLDLTELDVLVLPNGRGYSRVFDEAATAKLEQWVRNGGVLVAVGGAVSWLAGTDLVDVETWKAPESETEDNQVVELSPSNRDLYTPGAALATQLQSAHPLTSGYSSAPHALFQGSTVLLPSGDPRQDVLLADAETPVVAGFAWPEAAERLRGSLLMGARAKGRGAVILFAQEPAYRLFWSGTAPLFLNSVMYAPSLVERGRLLD
jgi:hypothetical protein